MDKMNVKKTLGKALKPVFMAAAALGAAAPFVFAKAAMAQDKAGAFMQNISGINVSGDMGLSSVAFVSPWVLGGLAALPLLWWLMRLNPPKPREVSFPAIRHLQKLESKQDQPASIPPWLRALRYTAAVMAIVGLAHPLLNPDSPLEGDGPVVMIVDNGAASAQNWQERRSMIDSVLNRAERDNREVMLLVTAAPESGGTIRMVTGTEETRRYVQGLEARPWPVDREAALKALETYKSEHNASVIWMSNGLQDDKTMIFAERLRELGSLNVYQDSIDTAPQFLSLPTRSGDMLSVNVKRLYAADEETAVIIARAEDGHEVHRVNAHFEKGEKEAVAVFELPTEIRNRLTSLSIEGQRGPGAVALLDERYRRRPVGLVNFGAPDSAQPLLSEENYIEQAISPYVDMRKGKVETLLDRDLAVMVMTGSTVLDRSDYERTDKWVRDGGTLLRFAGPQLAESGDDDLLPVDIRRGGRTIGGAMSWNEPAKIAPFEKGSPFYGIDLPDDVVVRKQVLAEPSVDLRERTWASLQDGTPLVTAERRGEGWIVLVHTTASPKWSSLAMSGLFVDMLRAVVAQSQGIAGGLDNIGSLRPWMTLDGAGELVNPPPAAKSLTKEIIENNIIGPQSPPGFYGDDSVRRAHNIAAAYDDPAPIGVLPPGIVKNEYSGNREIDLMGPLLAGAFLLAMLDQLIVQRRNRVPGQPGGSGTRSEPGSARRRDPNPGPTS